MKFTRMVIRRYISQPIIWLRNTRRMLNLICAFRGSQEANKKPKRIAVLVTPWLETDVPWFSIVSGLFFARRGNEVVFIVDGLPFGKNRSRCILWCIRSVMKQIARRYTVIRLCDYAIIDRLSTEQTRSVEKLAVLNAVWALKGEISATGRESYIALITKQLSINYSAIKALLAEHALNVIFIPGGIYGSSGIWKECASTAGVRVASYDSGGYGTLMLSANGIAAQLQDIPRAFAMLKARSDFEQEKQIVAETALAEMQRRREGTDKFASQMTAITRKNIKFNNGVLIALNSSWDSAGLGLHGIFENSAQWIIDTTRWLLDATDCDIIVRQHPAERLAIAHTSDDYHKLLTDNFGNNSRVCFIAADNPVNTYDLLSTVKVVIVYTSTIGTEAAALGKIVITPSKSYYSSLGFVWNTDNREAYFRQISNAIEGRYSITNDMKDDALCCYYLTQCCNWLFSPFNPEGFSDWSKYSLEELYTLDTVQLAVTSLQDDIPVASMNHLVNIENWKTGRG